MTGEKAPFMYNKERAVVAKRIAIIWSAIHTSQPVRLNPIGLYSFFDNIVSFNPNLPKDRRYGYHDKTTTIEPVYIAT